MSTAQEAMKTLSAQWYNAVVAACKLSSNTFQLFQGNAPLGDTSEGLWNVLNVVPPRSIDNLYNPSQASVFSSNYGGVVSNLRPQNSGAFEGAMGDYLDAWMVYKGGNPPPAMPAGGILELFKQWQ